MAASTKSSMPIDAYDADTEKAQLPALRYEPIVYHAKLWDDVVSTGGSLAAIGGGANAKWEIWTAARENDTWDYLVQIPGWFDRTLPIDMQVLFTGSATASKSADWAVTYNALALGDDFDIAPATALDTTIPAKAAADVDIVVGTYFGRINGYSIDSDEEFLMIRVKLAGGDSVTDWGFAGLKIYWPKAAS